MIASSPIEARAYGFCHVKLFDARRRVIGDGDDEDQQQEAAASGLKDGYLWLGFTQSKLQQNCEINTSIERSCRGS